MHVLSSLTSLLTHQCERIPCGSVSIFRNSAFFPKDVTYLHKSATLLVQDTLSSTEKHTQCKLNGKAKPESVHLLLKCNNISIITILLSDCIQDK